jgi:hypothetical protein
MESGGRTHEGGRWTCWILIGLMAGGGPAIAQTDARNQGGRHPRISVWAYNYAQVPEQTLDRGEKEAARIFCEIGVDISWGNCNPATTDIHLDANCTQETGPLNLALRILPGFATVHGVTNRNTMGLSFGYLASVSFRWVTEEAAVLNIAPSEILGPAIAHELGHLLLRQPGHSRVGIMRSRWNREDFQRAPLGSFSFTREQAESIRAEVRERSRAAYGGSRHRDCFHGGTCIVHCSILAYPRPGSSAGAQA